jgi:hypothetical protein
MAAAKLKSLLAKGRVVSDKLEKAASVCAEWYAAEPSLATFVLRGIFQDLIARGWDDPQGVPTAHYKLFKDGVLPHLTRVVDTLAATPSAEPIDDLDALVVAYRNSIPANP